VVWCLKPGCVCQHCVACACRRPCPCWGACKIMMWHTVALLPQGGAQPVPLTLPPTRQRTLNARPLALTPAPARTGALPTPHPPVHHPPPSPLFLGPSLSCWAQPLSWAHPLSWCWPLSSLAGPRRGVCPGVPLGEPGADPLPSPLLSLPPLGCPREASGDQALTCSPLLLPLGCSRRGSGEPGTDLDSLSLLFFLRCPGAAPGGLGAGLLTLCFLPPLGCSRGRSGGAEAALDSLSFLPLLVCPQGGHC